MTRHDEKEIFVEIIDMGTKVTEQVTQNADGSYTIFLNARYSYEKLQDAFRHAYCHIERHDFQKGDVQCIEAENHV